MSDGREEREEREKRRKQEEQENREDRIDRTVQMNGSRSGGNRRTPEASLISLCGGRIFLPRSLR
jgi:hypothetical protein